MAGMGDPEENTGGNLVIRGRIDSEKTVTLAGCNSITRDLSGGSRTSSLCKSFRDAVHGTWLCPPSRPRFNGFYAFLYTLFYAVSRTRKHPFADISCYSTGDPESRKRFPHPPNSRVSSTHPTTSCIGIASAGVEIDDLIQTFAHILQLGLDSNPVNLCYLEITLAPGSTASHPHSRHPPLRT